MNSSSGRWGVIVPTPQWSNWGGDRCPLKVVRGKEGLPSRWCSAAFCKPCFTWACFAAWGYRGRTATYREYGLNWQHPEQCPGYCYSVPRMGRLSAVEDYVLSTTDSNSWIKRLWKWISLAVHICGVQSPCGWLFTQTLLLPSFVLQN